MGAGTTAENHSFSPSPLTLRYRAMELDVLDLRVLKYISAINACLIEGIQAFFTLPHKDQGMQTQVSSVGERNPRKASCILSDCFDDCTSALKFGSEVKGKA